MAPSNPNISDVVFLRCSVGGTSNPIVTWTKNGNPFLSDSSAGIRIFYCSNSSLITIKSFTFDDNGIYECTVFSDGTTISQSVSIEVESKYYLLSIFTGLIISFFLLPYVHLGSG